jgi:low affinity Fe/Cu permease
VGSIPIARSTDLKQERIIMQTKHPKPLLRQLNNLYHLISHPYSFLLIVIIIVGWFVGGYIFHFDEEWYKAFHVFEMVIALLMVFLIENSTHSDNKAMQAKLDEIIKALPKANNKKIGLEKHLKGENI